MFRRSKISWYKSSYGILFLIKEYNVINSTHSCHDDELQDNKHINKIFTISTTNLKNAKSSKNYQSFSNLEIIDSKKNFLNGFGVNNMNDGKSRNREKSEFLRNRTVYFKIILLGLRGGKNKLNRNL